MNKKYLFTSLIASVFVLMLTSTTFAKDLLINQQNVVFPINVKVPVVEDDGDEVIPNFSGLILGEADDPDSAGSLSAAGKLTAKIMEGKILTNQIFPTASDITLYGNLNIDGDISADAFGQFYTTSEYCKGTCTQELIGDANPPDGTGPYDVYKSVLYATCDSGDVVVGCQGYPGTEWTADHYLDGGYYSTQIWASDTDTCRIESGANGVFVQAICFDHDGSHVTDPNEFNTPVIAKGDLLDTENDDDVLVQAIVKAIENSDNESIYDMKEALGINEIDSYVDDLIHDVQQIQIDPTSYLDLSGYVTVEEFNNSMTDVNSALNIGNNNLIFR